MRLEKYSWDAGLTDGHDSSRQTAPRVDATENMRAALLRDLVGGEERGGVGTERDLAIAGSMAFLSEFGQNDG